MSKIVLAIEQMQNEHNATISFVLPTINKIKALLRKPSQKPAIQAMKNAMLRDMEPRWAGLGYKEPLSALGEDETEEARQVRLSLLASRSFYLSAMLLDPRTKEMLHPEVRSAIAIKIRREMEEYKAGEEIEERSERPAKKRKVTPAEEFASWLDEEDEEDTQAEQTKDELDLYLSTPSIKSSQNCFQWWRDHRAAFPRLYQLAREYLQVPATSALVERSFSVTRCVTNDRNVKRSQKLTNALCLLTLNKEHNKTRYEGEEENTST